MKISLISVTSRTAFCEVDSTIPYCAEKLYSVFVNGEHWMESGLSCFVLSGLIPGKEYRVVVTDGIAQAELKFCTGEESVKLDVRDFGAVGDGRTDCTAALQAAVAACPANGTVYLPAGEYLSYPVFLHSDMTFFIEKGAVLRGGTERSRYPVLPGMISDSELDDRLNLGTWEGNPLDCFASLVTVLHAQNVVICGEGVIDGDAQHGDWWEDAKTRKGAWRPRTLYFCRCEGVRVIGVSVRNSPSWTVHPYYCKDVQMLGVHVYNPDDSPNTDGIDPECCEDVQIIGADISVGDDCIALKSGKYYMGTHHAQQTRRVTIRNCLLDRGHGAVVVGSEISAGVRGVCVEKCLMRDTDRGLRIKTRRGRGEQSVVEDVVYRNVKMENVLTPFVINMFYFCDPDGRSEYVSGKELLPVDKMTPHVGRLLLEDIVCTGAQYAGLFFYGLPERPIEEACLKNISIAFAAQTEPGLPAMMDGIEPMERVGLFAQNVKSISLCGVKIEGYRGTLLQIADGTNIEEEREIGA